MPVVACQVCSIKFYVKPNRLTKGWGKYCSNECKHSDLRTGMLVSCDICAKRIYKSLKEQRRSKSGKFFCSKSCQSIWRNSVYTGRNLANWKGGMSSYRDIMRRAKIKPVCARCKNDDSRVMAVHHKDKDRKNNSITNLIWLCHNCHYLVHHHKSEAKNFLVPVA